MSKSEVRHPPCMSEYDPKDRECNGHPRGETEADRVPCASRDRCLGLQKALEVTGQPLEKLIQLRKDSSGDEYTVLRKPDAVNRVIDVCVSKFGIKDGKIANPKGKTKKPQLPPSVGAPNGADTARGLASWFTEKLKEASARDIKPVMGDCEPGELFIIDRMDKSNYAACYCRNERGKGRIAVASMYPNARSGRIQIRIAVGFQPYVESLSKVARAKLSPQDCTGKDGNFKVRLVNLDKEAVALAAETVASAIEKGMIVLPEVC